MKLISFDVGIKNMAYCIFDISAQNLSINSWNVLNLLEEEPVSDICNQIIPGKTQKILPKPCAKIAKYRKNGQCYCEKHAKGSKDSKNSKCSPFLIPNKKNSPTYLKKQKVDELLRLGQSHFLFLDILTVPKLKKDILTELEKFYEKNCLEPISKLKTKNSSEIDLITIGKNMKELLNKIEGIHQVTHVIIENQISPIANRMKTIQGMLAQYFIMIDSAIHIEFVSSGNKLSQFVKGRGANGINMTPPTNKTPSKKTKLDTIIEKKAYSSDSDLENTIIINEEKPINPDYKQHKKDALYYGSLLLEKNHRFESHKDILQKRKGIKADDLADCFLQGIWYLKKQNIISYADDLKIIFV